MQALRTAFFGQTFKTSVATQQQPSSNATRQVTCMAKKKASGGEGERCKELGAAALAFFTWS